MTSPSLGLSAFINIHISSDKLRECLQTIFGADNVIVTLSIDHNVTQ